MSVAIVDFANFRDGTQQQRSEIAKRLTENLHKNGAVRLINHGVTAELIKEAFAWGEKFFKLPQAELAKIPNERNANPQRGWSYIGSEKTSKLNKVNMNGQWLIAEDESVPQDLEDVKEHFDFSHDGDEEFPSKWPQEASIPGFRAFMQLFLETCMDVAREILTGIELGLELPVGTLVDRCLTRVDELRLNHYPPLPIEKLAEGKHKRAWPHTDFGVITMLFQDAAGGLEVEDRKRPGSFIPINCESPTEVGVYVSDNLAHLTNDYLRAGVHQVVSPVSLQDKLSGAVLPERSSIAMFVKPDRHVSVGSIDKYVTAKHPRRYENITALDLHRKRVAQLYETAAY
ncbi:putative gibberellin 20-oxidase [Nemania abortiva]|nr:putative gibberellin 20-oxidase [Nemania abortiva]